MIRLYKEREEFGRYNQYNTETGVLSQISESKYNELKKYISSSDIFEGVSETHTLFPRRIYFQITRRCNLLCPYCFIKANSTEKDLPIDVIWEIIPYLGNNGLMEVRLTGGEPTLVKEFPEIIEEFQKHKVYVSVATNGLWSDEILNYFCYKKDIWLIVSIDGNREIHNKYRKDSYDKIVNNLIYLREHNPYIRLRLNTVLTTETLPTIESVFDVAKRVQAESITFIPLRPQVRSDDIKENFLRPAEFKSAIEQMIKFKKLYNVNFTTTIETSYKEEILPDKIFRKASSCAAGREGANLDYNYNIKEFMMYGCSYSPASDISADEKIRGPFLAGNFSFDEIEKLEQIWNDDSCWILFRDLTFKSDDCYKCNYYKKRCTGSCPIQNINFDFINIEKNILEQLQLQMKKNGEWYCYKEFI